MAKKVNPLRGMKKSKDYVKVIRTRRSPKTGSYTFASEIIHKDEVKNHLAK